MRLTSLLAQALGFDAKRTRKLDKLLRSPRLFLRDGILNRIDSPEAAGVEMTGDGDRETGTDRMHVLAIAFDDSTAFSAQNFVSVVSAAGDDVVCYQALLRTANNKDFVDLAAEGDQFQSILSADQLYRLDYLQNFDALYFAKVPPGMVKFCKLKKWRHAVDRPLLIGGFPGLEFTPHRGFRNRTICDILLFNTVADLRVYRAVLQPHASEQELLVGNPSILARWLQGEAASERGPAPAQEIAFLAQNITPKSLRARLELLRALDSRKDDPHPVVIKARQRHGGNSGHVHKELFSYESLAKIDKLSIPVVHDSMSESLERYDRFITCSSTGILEAAAMGKQVAFVSTFPGWMHDLSHVTGLAYATRYGWVTGVDSKLVLQVPGNLFKRDFALQHDNPLLDLAPVLRTVRRRTRQRLRIETLSKAPRVEPTEVTREATIRAYADAGNPHKALFLSIVAAMQDRAPNPDLSVIRELASRIDDESTVLTFVEPLLHAVLEAAPPAPREKSFAVKLTERLLG